jgi:hypothetical protein
MNVKVTVKSYNENDELRSENILKYVEDNDIHHYICLKNTTNEKKVKNKKSSDIRS